MSEREAMKELEEELSKALKEKKIYTVMCLRTAIEDLKRVLEHKKLGDKVISYITELEKRNWIYSINHGFGGYSVCVGVDEIEYEGETLEEALEKMAAVEFEYE